MLVKASTAEWHLCSGSTTNSTPMTGTCTRTCWYLTFLLPYQTSLTRLLTLPSLLLLQHTETSNSEYIYSLFDICCSVSTLPSVLVHKISAFFLNIGAGGYWNFSLTWFFRKRNRDNQGKRGIVEISYIVVTLCTTSKFINFVECIFPIFLTWPQKYAKPGKRESGRSGKSCISQFPIFWF